MKYAPHLPPALKGVSLSFKSGEKVRPGRGGGRQGLYRRAWARGGGGGEGAH